MFEDEHHGHDAAETGPELGFRLHWLGLGIIAAVGGGGTAAWTLGVVAVLGIVGIALTGANRHTYGEKTREFGRRYAFWMLPVWFVAITYLVGHFFTPYHQITQGQIKLWELLPLPPPWVPVATSFRISGLYVLLAVGVYASTVNALLLCKSRLVFVRTWAALVICAGALAILGLVQFFGHADELLWVFPLGNTRFFASFAHPALWSAFAILWMGAGFGLLGWLVRQKGWRWQSSREGWLLLTSLVLLAASLAVAGDPLHLILGAGVASLGSFVVAWQTWQERKASGQRGRRASIAWWGLAGLICAAATARVATQHPMDEWIHYDGLATAAAAHQRVIEDTQTMWLQRKWLGWGYNSFPVVYSFFQGADQNDVFHYTPRSDFWQSLAEHGIIGTLVWWVPVIWLVFRLLFRRRFLTFLLAPLAALAAIAGLSVVDFPFASPAVFFGFWFLLFSLARWVEVDHADAAFLPGEKKRIEKLRGQGQTLAQRPTTFATPSSRPKS